MPRFHLNVFNDMVTLDEEGMDLADLEAAQAKAVAGAREMIASEICAGRPVYQSHRIEITDSAGKVLHTVCFGDMVQLEP